MRLSEFEIRHIKEQAEAVFGTNSQVYLFGSRTDDTKKGGDIDLFIEPEILDNEFEQKIVLKTKLQLLLGLQKIDIVVARDPKRLIEQQANETKVLL